MHIILDLKIEDGTKVRMLLSVINDVINDYYHPELIKLYRKILIDLDFEVTTFNSEYIFLIIKARLFKI